MHWGRWRIPDTVYNFAFLPLLFEVDISVYFYIVEQRPGVVQSFVQVHVAWERPSQDECSDHWTRIPLLVPGSLPPPTAAYLGESLLIPFASGFFSGVRRSGWKALLFWAGE